MPSEFNTETFNELVSEFYKIKKRVVQKRPLSKNKQKVDEYIKLLIDSFNNILVYTQPYGQELVDPVKTKIQDTILHSREWLVRCFCKLQCKIRVPYGADLFETVLAQINTDSESDTDISESSEHNKNLYKGSEVPQEKICELMMATIEEKTKFISMCSNIIRENYNGDPLTLNSFLDKIILIKELTAENLETCFIAFIKSKLDGKAREVLPENISNITQITDTLKDRIRPDNAKIVEGRIAALSIKNNNYTEFSKNVEDLADALQRTLVLEGITKTKAQEMAIEQTIKICRKNARSEMVKAIIASTAYKEPKDVVAKLIVEEAETEKECQVLTMQYSRSNRGNGRNNRGDHNNSYRYNNSNRNNSSGNNQRSNNSPNYRGNNNYRGRGYANRGTNNRGYNQNFNNNPRRNGDYPAVRSLNGEAPQQEELGEEDQME